MFRELVRKKQALSEEECIKILKEEPRGVLSVQGDDGYPYGTPLNHWYCEDNGRLYFHSGMSGHRIDALKKCDKVSFCVYDQGYRKEGDWALYIKNRYLHTGGKNHVFSPNCSLYRSDLGFSKTKFINFSTFSK